MKNCTNQSGHIIKLSTRNHNFLSFCCSVQLANSQFNKNNSVFNVSGLFDDIRLRFLLFARPLLVSSLIACFAPCIFHCFSILHHPSHVVDTFPTENNRGSISLERGNDFHMVRFNSLEKCYESQ